MTVAHVARVEGVAKLFSLLKVESLMLILINVTSRVVRLAMSQRMEDIIVVKNDKFHMTLNMSITVYGKISCHSSTFERKYKKIKEKSCCNDDDKRKSMHTIHKCMQIHLAGTDLWQGTSVPEEAPCGRSWVSPRARAGGAGGGRAAESRPRACGA